MAGTGINRQTGKRLDGWAHVEQSLRVLYTTRIGSRVMRRTFGFAGTTLLGRSLSAALVLRFKTALIIATELWEPRFFIRRIDSPDTTTDGARQGAIGFRIRGDYRPRGHLGDTTSDILPRTFDMQG